jgi:hypothetical protein
MEEKILKIINKHIVVKGDEIMVNQVELAKEVASLYRGFTEWAIYKVGYSSREEAYEYCWGADLLVFYTLDELFNFWYDNVKDK